MTLNTTDFKNWSVNEYADFWRYEVGMNVIPADTKNKRPKVEWAQLQNKPIPEELHNHWKKENWFKDGMQIIAGQVWHHNHKKDFFLNCIDLDNDIAIKEFCTFKGEQKTLQQLADTGHFLVEQHPDDPTRAHVFVWSKRPFKKKTSSISTTGDTNVPRIEVKGQGNDGLVSVTPSLHANGSNYLFIGDWKLAVMEPKLLDDIQQHINEICENYGVEYLNGDGRNANTVLFKDKKIPQGERHNTLVSYANSIIAKLYNNTPMEIIRKYVQVYNEEQCETPLPEAEVEQIFKDVWNHIGSSNTNNNIDTLELKLKKNVKEQGQGQELLYQKLTKQDIDFVIDTMGREAKHDTISIKQLFYGMASTFTKIPIPHTVNSKNAGAGKSYLLNLVSSFYPSKHVMILAGASAKALHHREGVMVIKNESGELEEVEPMIDELEEEIECLDPKDKKRIKELESEIKHLKKHQQKLIELDNTIIIIQDTPEDALLVNLMSLSSQDSQQDQEYIFADKSSSGKIISGSNIIRGMPVLFTTRVIDDTRHARFEETNRRSINVTPNVSKEKIDSANNLIASKYGLLPGEYDQKVVSRHDKEKAKLIVSRVTEKLKHHSKDLRPKDSGVKIPFAASIANSIPSDDVWSMTVMDRMMRYLSIITKINMDSRPRFVNTETGALYPISTFEDLKETLTLMERGGSNLRPYIADWYNKVFIPAYNELPEEPNSKVVGKGDKETTIKEERKGLTSNQLAEKTKEILGKTKPSADELLKKYLYPLLNQGFIDNIQSQINKNNNLYFPSDEEAKTMSSFFKGEDLKLRVDLSVYPSMNLLEEELTPFIDQKHHAKDRPKKIQIYRLEDPNGIEICIKELVERYLSNPEICFGVVEINQKN